MKFYIGIDCEEIDRFDELMGKPKFLNRVFTEKELKYCTSKVDPKPHLAARFAGKEALIKAFSDAGIKIYMRDIEILNEPSGIPRAIVKGVEGFIIKISLSHSKDIAIAQALIVTDE